MPSLLRILSPQKSKKSVTNIHKRGSLKEELPDSPACSSHCTESTTKSSFSSLCSNSSRHRDLFVPNLNQDEPQDADTKIAEEHQDNEEEEDIPGVDEKDVELLSELQQTTEELLDKVTSEISVSKRMAQEALELHHARQQMGSSASSSFSLQKYTCQRMRLDLCESIREELSDKYQRLEQELDRVYAQGMSPVKKRGPARVKMDLFQVFNRLEELEKEITSPAPSAKKSNAKMVQQIGQMMLMQCNLQDPSS